jgi:hypothetical protein
MIEIIKPRLFIPKYHCVVRAFPSNASNPLHMQMPSSRGFGAGPFIFFFWSCLFLSSTKGVATILLLLGELWGANVSAAKLDVEHPLHGGKNLLVRSRGASLKVGDDTLGGIALGGEVLLRHLRLHLLSGAGDGIADGLADCVGLDNVVGAIDLGETLAITV